jgi:hypothetical protein
MWIKLKEWSSSNENSCKSDQLRALFQQCFEKYKIPVADLFSIAMRVRVSTI